MAPGLGTDTEAGDPPRVFRRTWSSRALALGGLLGSLGLILWLALAPGSAGVPAATWVVLGALALVSGVLVVPNFFDRITASAEGIEFSNDLLERLGWGHGRSVGWGDIASLREPRKKVLLLVERSGRIHVIDSIGGYEFLLARVCEAVASRTATSPEKPGGETPPPL